MEFWEGSLKRTFNTQWDVQLRDRLLAWVGCSNILRWNKLSFWLKEKIYFRFNFRVRCHLKMIQCSREADDDRSPAGWSGLNQLIRLKPVWWCRGCRRSRSPSGPRERPERLRDRRCRSTWTRTSWLTGTRSAPDGSIGRCWWSWPYNSSLWQVQINLGSVQPPNTLLTYDSVQQFVRWLYWSQMNLKLICQSELLCLTKQRPSYKLFT